MFYSPLEQFEIVPIFTFLLGSKFSFTNSSLFLFISVIVILAFFFVTLIKSTLVPNRWQSIAEMMYQFVQGMLFEALGEKGSRFLPFIFTTFTFIFFVMCWG